MRAFDAILVRQTMKARTISQSELARALGFTSQSAVSALLAGKRRVTVDEAAAIYDLLGLSDAAQTTAPTPFSQPEPASARFRETHSAQNAPDYAIVPVIGIAGAGRWREAIEMPLGHMPVLGRMAGHGVFGIEVSGDSMDQLIDDGGLILIDPGQKELSPGGVYLITNSGGEATVKRYRRDPARFEPCSNNPQHQSFLISDDDFSVLGKVVWKSAAVM